MIKEAVLQPLLCCVFSYVEDNALIGFSLLDMMERSAVLALYYEKQQEQYDKS